MRKHAKHCVDTTSLNPARMAAFASSSRNENREHHSLKPGCSELPDSALQGTGASQQACY